jgi:hypothetical protein
MDTIGVICAPDDAVFGRVAERLAARGFHVEFFSPAEPIQPADIDALDALVNQSLRRQALTALHYADRNGIETWNGYLATTAFVSRLVALHALERVGCHVPRISFEKPDGEYVEMTRYRWDCPPVISGGGDFYQEQVGTEPVVDRYYALNDGIETHLTTLQLRSKLTEHEPIVEETDVRVELATRIRELLDRFDARAIAVDFVAGEDGDFYAVGVDPVPGFDGADMDRRVADSMASLTTIGA